MALYLLAMALTLTWGWDGKAVDGGDLLAAAQTLGIPHPPGYPTYMLALKGFITAVPVGDIAYRGNLFSALCAALAVVLVYASALRLCRYALPKSPVSLAVVSAALGASMLAAAPLFWSQAVVTEVYTLNALFAAALLFIALHVTLPAHSFSQPHPGEPARADVVPNERLLLAAFWLLFGLGLGNHLTLLAVGAPLAVLLLRTRGIRAILSPRTVAPFVAGLSVYAYLPIRAAADPPVNWGDADSPAGFLWLVTARAYGNYAFGVPASQVGSRVLETIELIFVQLNPLGLFFAIVGGRLAIGMLPRVFWAMIFTIIAVTVYSIGYRSVDPEVLMVPAIMAGAVLGGVGFAWLVGTLVLGESGDAMKANGAHAVLPGPAGAVATGWRIAILGGLAFLFLPAVSIGLNYTDQDLSDDRSARERATEIMAALPPDAIVFSRTEKDFFSLWYVQHAEGGRPDVAVVAPLLLPFDWYRGQLERRYPDRVPSLPNSESQFPSMDAIVEHNRGNGTVYFTFGDANVADRYGLERSGSVYVATGR
ncbi:MAG: DUF2723 domain-containing protein [SAR202 cluster bacterium]|nr:DUF2723 domain-containing protein [SAR202 cluster bacterium]